MHMSDRSLPEISGLNEIVLILEEQLTALDGFGAHIAAAHLDAAIQILRASLGDRPKLP